MNARRRALGLVRTIHIYLSSLALGVLLFFAITGFLLNNGTRFGLDDAATRTESIKLSAASLGDPDKAAVEKELRQRLGNVGGLAGFEVEQEEMRVTFKRPGSRTEAVVDRGTGEAQITRESRGVRGIITDLHKGASASRWWKYVIDSAGILLGVTVLSGLVLMMSMPRRRWIAVAMAAMGTGGAVAVYVYLLTS